MKTKFEWKQNSCDVSPQPAQLFCHSADHHLHLVHRFPSPPLSGRNTGYLINSLSQCWKSFHYKHGKLYPSKMDECLGNFLGIPFHDCRASHWTVGSWIQLFLLMSSVMKSNWPIAPYSLCYVRPLLSKQLGGALQFSTHNLENHQSPITWVFLHKRN